MQTVDFESELFIPYNITISAVGIQDIKPYLHPLERLTQEIEHNGERFVPKDRMYNHWLNIPNFGLVEDTKVGRKLFDMVSSVPPSSYPYYMIQMMYEWKFDIHGLIDRGLALPIE